MNNKASYHDGLRSSCGVEVGEYTGRVIRPIGESITTPIRVTVT